MRGSFNWNQVVPIEPSPLYTETFSRKENEEIITASLVMPFQDIFACYDLENGRTKHELEDHFKKILIDPPKFFIREIKPKNKVDFTAEEDFWIYTYAINNDKLPIDIAIKQFKQFFYPIRTKNEIIQRINEIKENSKEENDRIIDRFAEQIQKEKIVAESIANPNLFLKSQKCAKLDENTPPFTRNEEIDSIQAMYPIITEGTFKRNEFARLISEKHVISMVRRRITLGNCPIFQDSNIDLRLTSDFECNHISNRQAVISFLSDCHFYIENIGHSVFRVNGVIIPPKNACILPDLSIIDFCDNLFMFVPNTELIKNIKNAYKREKEKHNIQGAEIPKVEPKIVGITLPNGKRIENPNLIF